MTATIDRTAEALEYSRARSLVKRYAAPHNPPVKVDTIARLAAARAFLADPNHAELASLPASLPSGSPIVGYSGKRVYRAMAETLGKRDSRKIANNTYLTRRTTSGSAIAVHLHGTDVATVDPDGTVTLNHAGWTTPTTAERLRTFISQYLVRAGGFPHGTYVGAAWLPDSMLADGGHSSWYFIVEDPTGRAIRREARYFPNSTRTIRGGYRFMQADDPANPYSYASHVWDPEHLHERTDRGAFRDFQVIERAGTYAHHPFPRGGFTIGPRGHIKSPAQLAREKRTAERAAAERRAAQYARDEAEQARRLALSDPELAREDGWSPVPDDTPLYKVLNVHELPVSEGLAGRAPYQSAFLWYVDTTYHVDGMLEPCRNALHAATREQLPQWYQGGPDPRRDTSNLAVYEIFSTGPAFSAQGKTFMRSARLGRILSPEDVTRVLDGVS